MDHRDVPLEVLREFARSLSERSSIRAIAEDAGVGRSTVHKFVTAGTMPHARVRRLLALWYLRRLDGINEPEVLRPYVAALDVLLGDAPEVVRDRVVLNMTADIERACEDAGAPPPGWVALLRARITRPDQD
jgi:hypothetical protein